MPAPVAAVHLTVELELTPRWWHRLVSDGLSPHHPDHNQALLLHARAIAAAMQLGGVQRLITDRARLVAVLHVSTDVTLETLCHRAGAVRDGLNALDAGDFDAVRKLLDRHR